MTYFEFNDGMVQLVHSRDERNSNIRYTMHAHTNIEMYYFISGDCIFHVEGNEYQLKPGDIMLMKPAESHFAEVNKNIPYERIVYNFDENVFSQFDANKNLLNPIFNRVSGQNNLFRLSGGDEAFYDLFSDLNESALSTLKSPIVYSKLLSALIKINEMYSKGNYEYRQENTEIYHIIRYINKNLLNRIDLESISEKFYISKSNLCKLFKASTGTTVWKYITTKRLLALKKELDNGIKPTILYQKYGFNDYSTFYRAFVKQFGYNPKCNKKTEL